MHVSKITFRDTLILKIFAKTQTEFKTNKKFLRKLYFRWIYFKVTLQTVSMQPLRSGELASLIHKKETNDLLSHKENRSKQEGIKKIIN